MKRIKYSLGVAVMAACWIVSICTLKGGNNTPPAQKKAPSAAPAPAMPAPVEPLPLPEKASEGEIIGLEFALYDPIPERVKKVAKRRK